MKKITTLGLLMICLCTSFKPVSQKLFLTDYRDTYTGTYACKSYNVDYSVSNQDNKLTMGTANIVITKDAQDSILQLAIGGLVLKTKLISVGLQPYPLGGKYGGRFFSTDSLSFFYTPNRMYSVRYMGKK